MKWFYLFFTQLCVMVLWVLPSIIDQYGDWKGIGILYLPIFIITCCWMVFVNKEWSKL